MFDKVWLGEALGSGAGFKRSRIGTPPEELLEDEGAGSDAVSRTRLPEEKGDFFNS